MCATLSVYSLNRHLSDKYTELIQVRRYVSNQSPTPAMLQHIRLCVDLTADK